MPQLVPSDDDRRILATPQSKAALAKLTPYLGLVAIQLSTIRPHIPSYVAVEIDGLLAAIDRWKQDSNHA